MRAAHAALAGRDAAALGLAAHSLKGSAAYVQADALSQHCDRIEQLADAGRLDDARPLLAELDTLLSLSLAALEPAKEPHP